jgi:hypothetical protein
VDVAVCVCGKKPHGDEGFERSRVQANQRAADRTLAGRHLKLALATSEQRHRRSRRRPLGVRERHEPGTF